MAQVTHAPQVQSRVDQYLDFLFVQWEGIAELAAEWDDESRRTFAANWGVPRDRLRQLATWEAEAALSAEQRWRLERLRPWSRSTAPRWSAYWKRKWPLSFCWTRSLQRNPLHGRRTTRTP
jgi:hypothetical protein